MISVIVPVYNVEKYLERCVDSLLAQTYTDLEVILVDDGSTDTSGKICDELSKKDDRITVIHKSNGGLSSARNAGIQAAKGHYLSFIDSDDFVEQRMLEVMYNEIKRTQKQIACCGRYVDVWGMYVKKEFCRNSVKVYSTESAIKELFFLRDIDVSSCDKLYDKEIFNDIKYPEGKISEDAAVILDIISASNGVVHVGEPFYHYIYRNESISKKKYTSKRYDVALNLEYSQRFTEKYFPNLKRYCNIYCCITAGSILIDMCQDKEALTNYQTHYIKFKELFELGFKDMLFSSKVKLKMKLRLIAVKTNLISVYNFMRMVYQKMVSFLK